MATTDRTTKLDDDLMVSAIGFGAGALTSVYGDVDDAAACDSLRDAPPSNRHLLVYDYVEDMAERWLPYREAHAERILSEREAGRILIAGRFEPPIGGALVFNDVDADWIETWVQADPYVKAGLVTRHRVNQWMAR
jgi:uncharacterized protein YciI